jgi:hypothetical protein
LPPGQGDGFIHSHAYLPEHGIVVLRVAFGFERVTDSQGFDQIDVRATHLLNVEFVVEKRFSAHECIELRFQKVGRDALDVIQAGPVEAAQVGEALPRKANPSQLPVAVP